MHFETRFATETAAAVATLLLAALPASSFASDASSCREAREMVEQTCATKLNNALLSAGFCAIQKTIYARMKCDSVDESDAGPESIIAQLNRRNSEQIDALKARAEAQRQEQQQMTESILAQRRAQAEQFIQQGNAYFMQSEARRAQEARDRVVAQQMQEQVQAESQKVHYVSDRNSERSYTSQRSANGAPSASTHGNDGFFYWRHYERYQLNPTQSFDGTAALNYHVFVQNTGNVAMRCGGNAQAQLRRGRLAGQDRVSQDGMLVRPGQTQELLALLDVEQNSGSYRVNCRASE